MKIIGGITTEIQKAIEFLGVYNVIFIPFIGPVGCGKSSIINGIIGEEILETGNNCTKKGIIIRYLSPNESEMNIRKTNFKEELFINKTNYYFEPEKNIIGRGLNQVKEILNALNYQNDEEKEEDSFYYVRTKIKLFDDLGLNDSIKRMIYLIDLPGFGTNKKFEKKIFPKLMSICNCFVFVVKNAIIKENEQQKILNSIFEQAKKQKNILTSTLIKSSLFIFNNFENKEEQTLNNKDIKQAKKDIMTVIKNYKEEDKENEIKLSFFNAKFYNIYYNNYNYFYNIKNTIMSEYKKYLKNKNNIFKNPETNNNKYNSFSSFLGSQLDEKNKSLFGSKNKKGQKIISKVEKDLIEVFQNINIDMKEKLDYFNKIEQKFSYGQEKIGNIEYLNDSNVKDLNNKIDSQIRHLNNNMQISLKKEIDNVIEKLDIFFSNTFNKERDYKEVEIFSNKAKEINKKLSKIYTNSQEYYFSLIENYKKKITNSLNQKLENIEKFLKNKNKNKIVEEINMELSSSIDELSKNIAEFLDKLNSEIVELRKEANSAIDIFSDGKIKTLIDSDFIDYFKSKVGGEGINLSKEIYDEIKIAGSSINKIFEEKGFIEWFKSYISNADYLKNCIEIIIKTFATKIEYILVLLIRELTNYIETNYHHIENTHQLATTEFTNEQKKVHEELSKLYEGEKEKIKVQQEKLIKQEI
jgi:hypothetical protein